MRRHFRAQSAMEYLMTYGWAIIIIAVVLAALFELGLFNGTFLGPREPPGACWVLRPGGPGSISNIGLQGNCAGLPPQFVANFNGKSSNVSAPISTLSLLNTGKFAVTAWIYDIGPTGTEQMPFSAGSDVCYTSYSSGPNDTGVILLAAPAYSGTVGNGQPDYFKAAACIWNSTYSGSQWEYVSVPFTSEDYGQWEFIAETYNGMYLNLYLNGVLVGSELAPGKLLQPLNYISVGNMQSPISSARFWFNGSLSNIQVYNSSLSANEVYYLYRMGLGSPPTYLGGLVLWLPMNGNSNDYSGNTNGDTFYSGLYQGWVNNYTYP